MTTNSKPSRLSN